MVTFLVNGRPIALRTLPNRVGELTVSLPMEWVPGWQGLTVEALVTLDYSECDNKPLAKESLWFSIEPETTFSFTGNHAPPKTIVDFFRAGGYASPLRLALTEYTSSSLKSLGQTSLLLGYLSKGLKKEVSLVSSLPDAGHGVLFKPGAGIRLNGNTLIVGDDAARLLSSDTLPLLAFQSVDCPSIGPEPPPLKQITFEALGWVDQTVEVVYTAEQTLGFSADAFGGIPQSAVLELEVSAAHFEEEETVTLAVFLNDRLVGSMALDIETPVKTAFIPLPAEDFHGYNHLRFEAKKYRGECKSVGLEIQSDSLIRWESVEPMVQARFYDFPYLLYGKTGIVVSTVSKETASILSTIMMKKGEGSLRTTAPELFTPNEVKEKSPPFQRCDSFFFLIDETEVDRFFPEIRIHPGLRLIHPKTGSVMFAPDATASYVLLFVGQYEGKPALLGAVHGAPTLFENITETQWRRLKQAPGNLALLTEDGQVVSFTVGDALSVGDPALTVERKLDLRRILWILVIVSALIIFLISSYRKTSSNR